MKKIYLVMTLVCMMMVSCKPSNPYAGDGKIQGYEYVDLGLSVKWATCNVGATTPEEFGNYYSWGELEPKTEYTFENCSTEGLNIGDITYMAEYNTAAANWDTAWRIPTYEEIDELCTKCTWEWTTLNDVNGYKVTAENGKSIFLPAAGYYRGAFHVGEGSNGGYWSTMPFEIGTTYAYSLYFNHDNFMIDYDGHRHFGVSVRPVSE